jgi:hypothetical protein
MPAQLQQARVKQDLIAAALQYRAFQVVVKQYARLAGPELKRMHMSTQKVFHRLIEEKLQIQGSRIRQRDHEAGQGTSCTAHHYVAEVRPVDPPLFAGERLQLQERFATLRTQTGDGPAQLHDASVVAAAVNHLVNTCGAQSRMLLQRLTDEADVGIGHGRPERLHVFETFAFNGVANGIGMDIQFSCDRADLPVFGIKITADLSACFGINHLSGLTFVGECAEKDR